MLQGEIVKDWMVEFPDTPNLTLAKAIYKANPDVFPSIDNIRSIVRRRKGQSGAKKRKVATDKTLFQDEPNPFNPFDSLPEGLTYYDEWSPYHITGKRVLVLADIHSPYYDRPALTAALKYGKEKDIDTVLFLGDLIDHYAVSFWEKDPRKRDVQREIDMTVNILDVTRQTFPDAKMIIKTGNHDERMERYLKVKAPELLGIKALTFEEQFQTSRFDIDIVADKRLCKMGELNLIHGHEFMRTFFSPVNPARGLYLRGKEMAVCAHFHRTSEHAEKSMTDEVTVCWSIGCLCDLRPEYAPYNSWNHGFAIIYQQGKQFFMKNKKIIDGEVY